MKSTTNFISDNDIHIGPDFSIGEYCLIGYKNKKDINNKIKTIIGKNANIRSHTVIYAGNNIGDNFQTGHGVLIREENHFGHNVSIGSHTVVEHHVKIGNNVRIHSNSFIPEYSILEDDVWIGPQVTFTNAKYPASPYSKQNLKGAIVKKGAKIGAACVILPGITIGEKVLVGAGSVVSKNIPEGKVVIGNPARISGKVSDLKYPNGLLAYP